MELDFVEVTYENLELAVQIQTQIFPDENGRDNYIEGITKNQYRKEMTNYIVFMNNLPIGVIGLYSYHEYPNDAWLSWFGVLEKFRKRGYGSKMFAFFEALAVKKGYTSIRVYTDDVFDLAIQLYLKNGMLEERYCNELESQEINDTTIIFSKSLTSEETRKWNNQFLQLTAQVEKERFLNSRDRS